MAEAARRGVAADDLVGIRVHGKGRAEVVERLERLLREEAALGQHGDEARRRVALGEHEAVALVPLRVGGVDVEVFEVENGEYVDDAQRTAHVRAAGPGHNVDDRQAQLAGDVLKFLPFLGGKRHCAYLLLRWACCGMSGIINREWILIV